MKRLLSGFIGLALVIGLLAACGKDDTHSTSSDEASVPMSTEVVSTEDLSDAEETLSVDTQSTESAEESSAISSEDSQDTPVSAEPVNKELEFQARYIRTGFNDDYSSKAVLINASSELTTYYLENKSTYSLDSEFKNILNAYDMSFFGDKVLVFVTCAEPSGSIRHEVKSAVYSEKDGTKELTLNIDRIIPEVGTDDMAGWHIIIELDRECAEAKDNIKVIMNQAQ